MPATGLTTTSYAILGHLALQPWTMYDLAQQMQRNVHFYFPRVESQIYAEPKKLVALGLAAAATEMTGRRARTIYSITAEGRRVLAEWLATPVSKGPLLEFEAVLRVMLAPFGSDDDLRRTLQQVRQDIQASILSLAPRISDEYAQGRAPFQRYAQYRSIMHDFLLSFGQLVDDWAERAQERMARWPAMTPQERYEEGVRIFDTMRPRAKPPLPPNPDD
ncbi:MAG TPA: PadR family transcriptional regulator [Hypericibacter adhaerens]|uniref:PadR family transcriptional regulator n=1 Tax=Hypericibacter adhaerens TaxID=2602016 RepID=UPI002BC3BF5B|nr:PadR family transcriptional regulator [Hypericibacter adhaerens]HWA43989.1 PadR family transcriptional regulator [Hypericibacter adhaerens]